VRYVQFSMPYPDAERLHDLAKCGAWVQAEFGPVTRQDERIVERIEAALKGKDLRVKNRYPKVKRPRVELDLRKKAS
jgi:hypothetical protein